MVRTRATGKSRSKTRKPRKKSELRRYGKVQWVPVQWIEPPHSVRYPHHLERLVRGMRRARAPSLGGRMWTGRPLLVEKIKPGWRHPGVRYVAWTGSHRIAAAFAAGQWLVPIVEIDRRKFDAAHGKRKAQSARLSETFDDESRLAMLMATTDERAIALMDREIPKVSRDKKEREQRRRDPRSWRALGRSLEAAVLPGQIIQVRHKGDRDGAEATFHKDVLEKLLEQLRLPAVRAA